MKYKVVIVEQQNSTDMLIGGTVYFATEAQARDFVAEHNGSNSSRAYVVTVSSRYSVTDKS
jgi:hypothetical protein